MAVFPRLCCQVWVLEQETEKLRHPNRRLLLRDKETRGALDNSVVLKRQNLETRADILVKEKAELNQSLAHFLQVTCFVLKLNETGR